MLESSFLLPDRGRISTSQRQNLVRSWLGKQLLGLLLAMGLLLAGGRVALAESVTVSDRAGVLDVARVKSEGAKLPYPLEVDTTNSFSGSQADFEGYARGRVSAAELLIVIAIDTVHRWVYIESGNAVPLSDSEAEDAYTAFKEHYRDGSYTGATLAAIQSLEESLTGLTETSSPDGSSGSVNQGFDWTRVVWPGCFCISTVAIFFLAVGAAANEDAARQRRRYRGGKSSTGFGRSSYGGGFSGTGGGAGWGFSDSGGSAGGSFSDSGGSAGGSFSDSGGSAGGSFSDSGGSAGGSFSDSGGGAGGSF
ncbi:hypothetical protein [Thermogemmatispora onikobensis]|uniref:hypothetical protein n=1 Tax=Thermogemmatispora onikobensis TaxID=732234 RepID=UPI0008532AD8|nr:hypothetical protein [Thermogemmatispora onikobensis]